MGAEEVSVEIEGATVVEFDGTILHAHKFNPKMRIEKLAKKPLNFKIPPPLPIGMIPL